MFANPLYLIKLALSHLTNFPGNVNLFMIGFLPCFGKEDMLNQKLDAYHQHSVTTLNMLCTNVAPSSSNSHIFVLFSTFS